MEWRWIPGFENRYEVSDTGIVRSHFGNKIKILRCWSLKKKYLAITLYFKGNSKHYLVSRLVAETFIGEIPKGMEVDHRDQDRQNNCVSNLRIVTKSQNVFNSHSGKKRNKGASSKYRGVSKRTAWNYSKPWRAQIRRLSLGFFATEEEAARAYDIAAIEILGGEARLNFPNKEKELSVN